MPKYPLNLRTTLTTSGTRLEEERVGLFFGGEGDEWEKIGEWTGDSEELVLPPTPQSHPPGGICSRLLRLWKQSWRSESNEEKLILDVAFLSSEEESVFSF